MRRENQGRLSGLIVTAHGRLRKPVPECRIDKSPMLQCANVFMLRASEHRARISTVGQ
jgi:hypothetical protein